MKLELKHIAPYLPYGLKGIYQVKAIFSKSPDENRIKELRPDNVEFFMDFCKPILRPLSDLNKEIEHNGEKYVPNDYFYKNWWIKIRDDGHFSYDHGDGTCTGYLYMSASYDLIQQLLEWHFDVFGLIKQELAININDL